MINIAQRPQEADDRAVPGHWEGDLMIGKANQTAIGTLVERSTGYALLVHLPDGYKPEQVAPALAAKIQTLPDTLRRSLTWDQGAEMRDWKQVRIDTGIEIYFCDPNSPWQRGTPTKTPTGCYASTSPKAQTSANSPRSSSTRSPTNSTTDPANASASTNPPNASLSYCCADRKDPPIGERTRQGRPSGRHARGRVRLNRRTLSGRQRGGVWLPLIDQGGSGRAWASLTTCALDVERTVRALRSLSRARARSVLRA